MNLWSSEAGVCLPWGRLPSSHGMQKIQWEMRSSAQGWSAEVVVFDLQSQGEVFGCFVFRISMYFFFACCFLLVGWFFGWCSLFWFGLVFPVTYVHVAIVNGKLDGK